MSKIASLEIEIAANVARLTEDFSKARQEVSSSMGEIKRQVSASMKGVTESIDRVNEHIKGMQEAFAAISEVAIGGVIGEKILDMGRDFAEASEQISRTARITGMTTDQVQELGFAAQETGASSDAMALAMRKLSLMILEANGGSQTAISAFRNVGISQEEIKSSSPHDILMKVANAYSRTADNAFKSANAQQLFGRAGTDLIPTLDQGSAGLDAMAAKAHGLGIVLDRDTIEKGEQASEKFKEIHAVMGALALKIGADMVPAMTQIAGAFADASKKGGLLFDAGEWIGAMLKELAKAAAMTGETFAEWGMELGGYAAAAVAFIHGNFSGAHEILKEMDQDVDALRRKTVAFMVDLDKAPKALADRSPEGGTRGHVGSVGGDYGLGRGAGAKSKNAVAEWSAQFEQWKDAQQNYFKDYTADEAAYWQNKLTLVKKGSKEWDEIENKVYALHKQQAHAQLQNDLADIKAQFDAARQGSNKRLQLAQEEAQRIGQTYGAESRQYKTAMKEVEKAAQDHEKAMQRLAEDEVNQAKVRSLNRLAIAEERLSEQAKLGQISDADRLARQRSLKDQAYAIEVEAQQRLIALVQGDPNNDPQALQKRLDQLAQIQRKHALDMEKLHAQAAEASAQAWQKAFQPVAQAFDTSIKGMILGTTTLQKAMANMAQSIVSEFVNAGVKMVTQWVANELAKTAATETGVATRTAAQAVGDSAGLASSAMTVIKAIMNDAAKAFSGVWAALSGIPVVGPALAAAAAPAAMATVVGITGSVASSSGGDWQIPSDRLNFVHRNETILPADKAVGLDRLISSSDRGGDTHLHVHAMDAAGVAQFFDKHKTLLARTLQTVARNNPHRRA